MSDAYAASGAERWGVSREAFDAAVAAAMARGAVDAASLHLEDLALAVACAEGREAAWEHVIRTYRPQLQRAADAMDRTGRARETADALFGELFAPPTRAGAGASLFRYFHGRSALGTWLRAVLAQRHVDRLREGRRLEPLPDVESAPAAHVAGATDAAGTANAASAPEQPVFVEAVQRSLTTAIASLDARDRLRLRLYYADQLTLAEIGRLTREHEATVSRQLARTRRDIRAAVERALRDDRGFDAAAIEECLRAVANDPGPIDLAEVLSDAR